MTDLKSDFEGIHFCSRLQGWLPEVFDSMLNLGNTTLHSDLVICPLSRQDLISFSLGVLLCESFPWANHCPSFLWSVFILYPVKSQLTCRPLKISPYVSGHVSWIILENQSARAAGQFGQAWLKVFLCITISLVPCPWQRVCSINGSK